MIEGVDLSRYQGKVDFDEVRQAGAKYALLKATEGLTYVDPEFYRSAACGAHNAVWVGSYHYFLPDLDPEKQAIHYASIAEDATSLRPICDFEALRGIAPAEATNRAEAFMAATDELWGAYTILYSYPYFLQPLASKWTGRVSPHRRDLWIAHYTADDNPWLPLPWAEWLIWQYDGDGGKRLPSGQDCDWNRTRDLVALMRDAGSLLR